MSLFKYERNREAQELIRILRSANSEEVRKRAAEILGRLGDHEDRRDIVRALVRAAQEDDSGVVIATAIDSLDELGQDALESLIGSMTDITIEEDVPDWVKAKAFLRALDSDIPELRMAAANALGELAESETVPRLIDQFDDPDPRVRSRVARACGQIADPRATSALEGLLGDRSAKVRREAADALGRIGNRQALQALLGLYDDENEQVRRIAVSGFGTFDNDRPVEYLVTALTDKSATVRRTAVFSLIELLSNVPTQQSHQIRETVVEQLAASEDETVVTPLVEILTQGTQTVQRRNAAWLLGRVMDDETNREAVDALVDALEDGDRMTKQFASTSLAEIGGTYTAQALQEIADNPDSESESRAQAIFALGKVGTHETAMKLEALLDETDDEMVRKRAFSALSKLGGRQRS